MATVMKKPSNKKKSDNKKLSEKHLTANRANAKRSTGAETRKRKEQSIQNVLKLGLRSQRGCLETENKTEFQEFEAYMLDDMQPEGALEELLANKVIIYGWKSLLAQGVEEAFFEEAFDPIEVDCDDEKSSAIMLLEFVTGATANLSPFMTAIDYCLFRSLKEFRELRQGD